MAILFPRGFEKTTDKAIWSRGFVVGYRPNGFFDILLCKWFTKVNYLLISRTSPYSTIAASIPKSQAPSARVTPNQVLKRTSYVTMLDPNEGDSVNFVLVSEMNGIACATIKLESVQDEIDY